MTILERDHAALRAVARAAMEWQDAGKALAHHTVSINVQRKLAACRRLDDALDALPAELRAELREEGECVVESALWQEAKRVVTEQIYPLIAQNKARVDQVLAGLPVDIQKGVKA